MSRPVGDADGVPLLSFAGAVATIAFNRPEKRNALARATWLSLPGKIEVAAARIETRLIVLRGAGGNFAAGADIGEFDDVFADPAAASTYLAEMSAATAAIEAVPLPVIALIEGLCIGAGVAVALACDLRLAAADARFAVTPAKLGLAYSLADTGRLVAAVGASAARNLLFTAALIDAPEALTIGLIDAVAAAATAASPTPLDDALAERAALIVAGSSWTHARSKAMVRRILDGKGAEDDESRGWFADAAGQPDLVEGLAAFRGRRGPQFRRPVE